MGAKFIGSRGSSELSPIVRLGSGLTITALLAACTGEVEPTIPTPEATATQPRVAEFTPTPIGDVVSGISPEQTDILAAYGAAVGAGGPTSLNRVERLRNTSFLQGVLNQNGLAPILDGEGNIATIGIQANGERVCFPNMPEKLYNPNVPFPHEDAWLRDENFVRSYGDGATEQVRYQAIGAISIGQTRENVICVNAFINRDANTFDARLGTLFNVLLDQETGQIYGSLPAVYGADERVQFNPSSGRVTVGNENVWYIGDNITLLTPTPEPSQTPEPMPTTCLKQERNQQVVDQFLQDFGFSSLSIALGDPNKYFTGHAGFENGPSWYRMYDLKVLGGYRFSLVNQPGFGRNDYAYCILGATPHEVVPIPLIIGLERNGRWSQTVLIRQSNNPSVIGKLIDLNSADAIHQWVEGMRDKNIHPLIVARFNQPDWEQDPLWYYGYDAVLPLLRNPNGYIMKYTRIPTTIGPSASFPEGMPGNLSAMIQDFNLQPGGDVGLFTFQITVRE